jgi:glycosyltransferase involved in cell wall biosynthesis
MKHYDLSVIIPARNEEFLARTVHDVLEMKRGKTEVIAVLDGAWTDPPLVSHKDLTIIYNHTSIGQRASTNQAARLSRSRYVMKLDAHCTVDEGFDEKMMALMQDNYTMIPIMYNLHAFDWVCPKCEERQYQGPSEKYRVCPKCQAERHREIIWKPRWNRKSTAYRFDTTLHFQYWGSYKEKQKEQGDLADTLSIQGSCFMATREKYFELNLCDEEFGSWGQQGTEVACKTWLSGGRVVTNMTTWYAHMFRTQGGDFGFPYPLSQKKVDYARERSRDMFFHNKYDKQVYSFTWLLDKFKPIPEWHEEKGKDVLSYVTSKSASFKPHITIKKDTKQSKGIIYYTDNQLRLKLAHAVQRQLKGIGLPIVSVSLKPMTFGDINIHLPFYKGYLTMFYQIYEALKHQKTDIIFFCEHDVLYHPTHFEHVPEKKDTFYYNINVLKVDVATGKTVKVDVCQQVSGISVLRETALAHYAERIRYVEQEGRFSRNLGFEPGTHSRVAWSRPYTHENWQSQYPNLDLRHDKNLTANRWSPDEFRNKRNASGWTESTLDKAEGWTLSHTRFQ